MGIRSGKSLSAAANFQGADGGRNVSFFTAINGGRARKGRDTLENERGAEGKKMGLKMGQPPTSDNPETPIDPVACW